MTSLLADYLLVPSLLSVLLGIGLLCTKALCIIHVGVIFYEKLSKLEQMVTKAFSFLHVISNNFLSRRQYYCYHIASVVVTCDALWCYGLCPMVGSSCGEFFLL